MIKHRHVHKLLYEYLHGELEAAKQVMVEHHLATCKKCSDECDLLKSAIEVLGDHGREPSKERTQEFWNAFAFQVEDRIPHGQQGEHKRTPATAPIEWVFAMHRRRLLLLGGSAAAAVILVLGFFFLRQPSRQQVQVVEQPALQQGAEVRMAAERLHQYFRKSKVLLVGIANMKVDEEGPIDLSAERKVSRDLVQEARYLQTYPLDTRSEKLISDLEKILIELANMKEQNNLPNVEILRRAIHQENLLFKIRMAESTYDTSQVHFINDKN